MADPNVPKLLIALEHRVREHEKDVNEAAAILLALLRTWIPDPENTAAQRTGRRARRLLAAWQERTLSPGRIRRR